jgi:hypothetical protein
VTEPVVAESSAGRVEIEFGVNRWVMVTVDALERQKEISSERGLSTFLRELGLYPNEAEEVARKAWRGRPQDAAGHLPPEPPNWTLLAPSGWRDGALILAVLGGTVALLVYLMMR